jgi:mannose-1-phosphate guanylyltransferase
MKFIPAILSGWTGTRLWRVSRELHPKPFMQLAEGESLLRKAFQFQLGAAPGKRSLEMIEVQGGEYLAEDDIVRFDNRYGRVAAQ